jgi:nitroimidazol reductase NimA-like FMN-containing flavoprotein (pyridoxamine 5'-phosphate oxidase superfamily)
MASSPAAGRASTAESVELSRGECLELLATGVIGRVVVTDGALPAAHPVAYVLDDEEVVFRTASSSKLAAAARHKVVAFEVDQIDVGTRTGWSVLGVGQAEEVVDPGRLAVLAGRPADPWVPPAGAHVLAIPLQRLSGRRLHPAARATPAQVDERGNPRAPN